MRQKIPYVTIIITSLFAVVSAIVINFATSQVPSILVPLLPFTWPLVGFITLFGIGLAIWQFRQQQEEVGYPDQARLNQNRRQLLSKVRAFWITGVLEQSLHEAALITLGLREQPDAVENPWHLILQGAGQPADSLPIGTRILEVYDKVGSELLILGEAGSGKSTLILELARELLNRASSDDSHPIPVVLNLASWTAKRSSLAEWLVEELNNKYQVPHKLSQIWIKTDQVLPLLDGLDEVTSSTARVTCIETINTYRKEHGLVPMVVSCRSQDYLDQSARLLLRSAVTLQPLTAQQIDNYLTSAGGKLAAVRVALHKDKTLQELATTPLMLSVLTLAYQEKTVEDLQHLAATTPEMLQREVFKTYTQRMLTRREVSSHYTYQQTIYWLSWLARQMLQHSQTELYLKNITSGWLEENPLYQRCFGVVIGLMNGLGAGLLSGLLLGGVIAAQWGQSWGVVSGLLIGFPIGVFTARFVFSEKLHPVSTPVGLPRSVQLRHHAKHKPNPAKVKQGKSAFGCIGMLSMLVFSLILALIPERGLLPKQDQHAGLAALLAGLWFAMLVGVRDGGFEYIEYIVLKLFLWYAGYTPLRYISFLDYATKHILLRKVGSGYIFVHRLLLVYLATLDTSSLFRQSTK